MIRLSRFVGLVAVWALLACTPQGPTLADMLPEAVGEYARVSLTTGDEAVAENNKLHGKDIAVEECAIGRYAPPNSTERPAEIWISRTASTDEARRQTGSMVHRMFENPRSPFSNPKALQQGATMVYRFSGMGQSHLIFFVEDRVYWVSCGPDAADEFLAALIP